MIYRMVDEGFLAGTRAPRVRLLGSWDSVCRAHPLVPPRSAPP